MGKKAFVFDFNGTMVMDSYMHETAWRHYVEILCGRYLTVVGDKMYFINYRLGGVGGDSHLYSVELGGSHAVEKLA